MIVSPSPGPKSTVVLCAILLLVVSLEAGAQNGPGSPSGLKPAKSTNETVNTLGAASEQLFHTLKDRYGPSFRVSRDGRTTEVSYETSYVPPVLFVDRDKLLGFARAKLEELAPLLSLDPGHFSDPKARFRPSVTWHQTIDDVVVDGGYAYFSIHSQPDSHYVVSVSTTATDNISVNTRPTLSAEQARLAAINHLRQTYPGPRPDSWCPEGTYEQWQREYTANASRIKAPFLQIVRPTSHNFKGDHLVYKVDLLSEEYWVDAHTGALIEMLCHIIP